MRTPRTRFRPVESKQVGVGVRHLYVIGGVEVSVIMNPFSYGGKDDLWEALHEDGKIRGWLTDEDAFLTKVAA